MNERPKNKQERERLYLVRGQSSAISVDVVEEEDDVDDQQNHGGRGERPEYQ